MTKAIFLRKDRRSCLFMRRSDAPIQPENALTLSHATNESLPGQFAPRRLELGLLDSMP